MCIFLDIVADIVISGPLLFTVLFYRVSHSPRKDTKPWNSLSYLCLNEIGYENQVKAIFFEPFSLVFRKNLSIGDYKGRYS